MSGCNHTIMIMNYDGPIRQLDTPQIFETMANEANIVRVFSDKEFIEPEHYIDRRRGYAELYNFCPYCGEKINWSAIRKMVKGMKYVP